jgi:hypothetical protein
MAKKKSKIVQVKPAAKPVQREDPFQLFFYHVKRLPWYFIKFWDWLFTLITALIVYLTR